MSIGVWVKRPQIFDKGKEIIKAENFIVQSNVVNSYIRRKDLKIDNRCMHGVCDIL
ncbi:hypothetical protein [Clostridium beijerinckii]|uniref:hypothetical protein n=1 Tax=Clostridium beijerinckii TaxID=1520 RepID=UPI001361B672|nr:hypothetical protein [Clostridium beijerinckii]MZK53802.1 hypothetical protein [Clostridium beijerinckii]MZK60799.1 hypothetical protein [Clostridium beijerinckii]MZK72117.1 hypothetical protein [Clostridium beijerinckii]MZK77533.1 hypothetical protein [Clostridium beijerinckii]MZK87073.1 hypothetical protein [Clostridium beijerinckii]